MSVLAFRVPPSKSVTHRAYILAAACDKPTRIVHPLRGQDCESTLAALSKLGANIRFLDDSVIVSGPLSLQRAVTLDMGNSGTSLRLLLVQAALLSHRVHFTGDASLKSRPNVELLEALSLLGAQITATNGCAPIEILGPIQGGVVELPSGVSSQFASGLLLGLANRRETSKLFLSTPIHSRPYFDISLDMARTFGCEINLSQTEAGLVAELRGGDLTSPGDYFVEGDWSSAAFLLVAAWALNQPITLNGLKSNSLQADRRIETILSQLGCSFVWDQSDRLKFSPGGQSPPRHVNVRDCPDLFPILCVLAAVVPSQTTISGAPNLRHKESDRIQLMAHGLQRLGVTCHQLPDGIVIEGGTLESGRVETQRDHRIRMSFRVLAAVTNTSIELDGEGCEKVSYPSFESDLSRLLTERQRQ